ncbi:MAG: histidine phosphotransferase family protein [Rickettsiaceae bacterium]|nr:histidine phosphotransferase family protein [Rickettsiaceae bacterium]
MNTENNNLHEISHFMELSQYITTKICHDLSGILGALGNVSEFLESKDDIIRKKAMELLDSCAKQTIARLIFYRNAYGMTHNSTSANFEELNKITQDYLQMMKIRLNFNQDHLSSSDPSISSDIGKLIICLAHHASYSLIYGGTIEVNVDKDQKQKSIITISASGQNINVDSEKISIVTGEHLDVPLSTKNCISFFIYYFANLLKISISVDTTEKDIINYNIIL